MLFKVDNVGAERMCSGRLFQATGPATQTAWLPSCSLVLVQVPSISWCARSEHVSFRRGLCRCAARWRRNRRNMRN